MHCHDARELICCDYYRRNNGSCHSDHIEFNYQRFLMPTSSPRYRCPGRVQSRNRNSMLRGATLLTPSPPLPRGGKKCLSVSVLIPAATAIHAAATLQQRSTGFKATFV